MSHGPFTGSIAAGYYAQPRMTRDIDLVVGLRPHKNAWRRSCGLELTMSADWA